jgi:hypothetical protein
VANDAPHDDASKPRRGASEPATDALQRLEERLDRVSRAAERLIAQARAEVRSAGMGEEQQQRTDVGTASEEPADATSAEGRKPPLAGWQAPSGSADGTELELLTQLLHSLRDLLPPDLQRLLAEAVRELLLALRALIDFYLERLERRSAAPADVQDIPIS